MHLTAHTRHKSADQVAFIFPVGIPDWSCSHVIYNMCLSACSASENMLGQQKAWLSHWKWDFHLDSVGAISIRLFCVDQRCQQFEVKGQNSTGSTVAVLKGPLDKSIHLRFILTHARNTQYTDPKPGRSLTLCLASREDIPVGWTQNASTFFPKVPVKFLLFFKAVSWQVNQAVAASIWS